MIMTLLSFMGLKLLHLILYFCRNLHSVITKIYLFVQYQTKWWTLIVGVIEANGILLAFSCGLQMELLAAKDGLDKINTIFMVLMLFTIIIYGSSFYLLIGTF